MIQNPSLSNNEHSKILDGRNDPRNGSKWDRKKHESTELTYFDLRYKMGEAAGRSREFARIAFSIGVTP